MTKNQAKKVALRIILEIIDRETKKKDFEKVFFHHDEYQTGPKSPDKVKIEFANILFKLKAQEDALNDFR